MLQAAAAQEPPGAIALTTLALVAGVVVALVAILVLARRRRAGEPPAWETGARPSLFDGSPPQAQAPPLWSRPPGDPPADPAPGDEAAEAAHAEIDQGLRDAAQQPRLRGLLILNLPPAAGPEHIEEAPVLGAREAVVARIREAAPGLEFNAGGRGEIAAVDHDLRIEIGSADPVATAVVAASGRAGIDILRGLLIRTGWRAYAPRTGSFVDPDDLLRAAAPPQP
jgi:hypothetical protein